MKNRVFWTKTLLWLHLFVCLVWLSLFRASEEPPNWTIHVFLLSLMVIQFTWSLTVGLLIGPRRKRRPLLWASLMLIFMPMFFVGSIAWFLSYSLGLLGALAYLAAFVIILACETYSGVMLGAKLHGESEA